jgi:hypothetical protein
MLLYTIRNYNAKRCETGSDQQTLFFRAFGKTMEYQICRDKSSLKVKNVKQIFFGFTKRDIKNFQQFLISGGLLSLSAEWKIS